jgi:hypothetical protein
MRKYVGYTGGVTQGNLRIIIGGYSIVQVLITVCLKASCPAQLNPSRSAYFATSILEKSSLPTDLESENSITIKVNVADNVRATFIIGYLMDAVQNSINEAYPLNYTGVERRGSERLGWAHNVDMYARDPAVTREILTMHAQNFVDAYVARHPDCLQSAPRPSIPSTPSVTVSQEDATCSNSSIPTWCTIADCSGATML